MLLGRRMNMAMGNFMRANDERIKVTNETMQGIRVVKFTGLEDAFVDRVSEARDKQCRHLYRVSIIRSALHPSPPSL